MTDKAIPPEQARECRGQEGNREKWNRVGWVDQAWKVWFDSNAH